MPWIEVFRTGTHTDGAGNTRHWSEADLDQMVALYRENYPQHEAPLVVGHPETDGPAHGWVEKLKREGQKLFAWVKPTNQWIQDAVGQGLFRKVSIALYDGGLLRHVGLLGANPPAVRGLAPVRFSAGEFTTIWGGVHMDGQDNGNGNGAGGGEEVAALKAEIARLTKELEAMKADAKEYADRNAQLSDLINETRADQARTAFAAGLDGLIRDGRVLPAERDGLLEEFADLHRADQRMEFAEGEQPLTKRFADRLAARPVLIEPPKPGRFADKTRAVDRKPAGRYAAVDGATGAEVDAQALAWMEKNPNASYRDALAHVMEG